MLEFRRVDTVADIVDLGCGTARFSEALADVFDAGVIGVDPSQKMLDQVRNKIDDSRISFRLASGEALPMEQGSADKVFMSMVLHLADPQTVAHKCHRIVHSGGHVCLRNST